MLQCLFLAACQKPYRFTYKCRCGKGACVKSFCDPYEHHEQNQFREKRIYFILKLVIHYSGTLRQELKEGRNLEAEATEGCCLLTCFLWLHQPAFLEHPGPSAQWWHCPPRAPPSLISQVYQRHATGPTCVLGAFS